MKTVVLCKGRKRVCDAAIIRGVQRASQEEIN